MKPMKHKITLTALLLLALFAASPAFALPDDDNPMNYRPPEGALDSLARYYDFSPRGVQVFISPDWVLFDGEKIAASEFRLGTDGFYYLKDNIVIFDQFHHLLSWHNTTLDMRPALTEEVSYGAPARYTPSSFLTETVGGKKVAYDGSDLSLIEAKPLLDGFYSESQFPDGFFVWNDGHKPWATDGSGVGESITADFSEEVNVIHLLNGYVDPHHPDYYRKNSRVKDIKITDEANGGEYFFTLADEVRVQSFMLDSPTTKLTLTVLSVYGGEKYADTALSLFSGAPADAYLDWIEFRELEAAKNEAEHKLEIYEWEKENYPEDIPRGLLLIKQDWALYTSLIKDKIETEFGGESAYHDIEIYESADLKIHLESNAKIYLSLYAKEEIKEVSYVFKTFYTDDGKPISKEQESAWHQEEKDGWHYWNMHFGNVYGEYLSLPVHAEIEVEYESGRKQKVVLPKESLERVKRFGELMIGAAADLM